MKGAQYCTVPIGEGVCFQALRSCEGGGDAPHWNENAYCFRGVVIGPACGIVTTRFSGLVIDRLPIFQLLFGGVPKDLFIELLLSRAVEWVPLGVHVENRQLLVK
jgi:hypothetical protein